MQYNMDRPPFVESEFAGGRWPWQDIVDNIFDHKSRLLFNGLLMTQPGAAEQEWHADGEHLFPGSGLLNKPHCINVLVPLVEMTAEKGATQFCKGSHTLTEKAGEAIVWQDVDHKERIGVTEEPLQPEYDVGDVLLFDYRLLHRAVSNPTEHGRPVLYFTHAKQWFSDAHNFPTERSLHERSTNGHV
jgi:ectoine hydroxylase-related dioxygenase (phytanoyl-CoA dioxygenase family)